MCSSESLYPLMAAVAHCRCRVCLTMIISFTARALSSINGDIFCYNAISSASIVSILPGFLIRKFGSPTT